MARDETDPQPSLGELLGIDVLADLPDLPEQVWEHALDIATDPNTSPADPTLIPAAEIEELDLGVDPTGEIDVPGDLDDTPDPYVHEVELPEPATDLYDDGLGL